MGLGSSGSKALDSRGMSAPGRAGLPGSVSYSLVGSVILRADIQI